MNNAVARLFTLSLAEQARIEGMKVENAQREARGASVAYREEAFAASAHNLELLAVEMGNSSHFKD